VGVTRGGGLGGCVGTEWWGGGGRWGGGGGGGGGGVRGGEGEEGESERR